MSLLAIDAGNSRIKWAINDNGNWHSHAFVVKDEDLSSLKEASQLAKKICVCNVGGTAQQEALEKILNEKICIWVTAQQKTANVINNYEPYSSLGADRWCSILALYEQYGESIAVMAGTAVTVDPINSDGQYNGGIIIPGKQSMIDSLNLKTNMDVLIDLDAKTSTKPNNTKLAIATGIAHAVSGAVKSFIKSGDLEGLPLIITGGDAPWLSKLIKGSKVNTNLIFDGLLIASKSN